MSDPAGTPRRIQVTVDATRCVGSGNCEFWAPGVFEVGDDGVAEVVGDPSLDPDATAAAVENCPTLAITAR